MLLFQVTRAGNRSFRPLLLTPLHENFEKGQSEGTDDGAGEEGRGLGDILQGT